MSEKEGSDLETGVEKEGLTLQRYLEENCYNGIAKLRFFRRQNTDGDVYLRVEVRGLGKRPYAFRLEGDEIVTAAIEAARAKKRVKAKKSAKDQKIEKGVKEALA